MTELDNDKLLRDFFSEGKQEIKDNGFSHRVMQNLPNRSNRLAQCWTVFVMAVGAVLFIWLGGLEATWATLREVFLGTMSHEVATLNPQSIIIAAVVLIFLGTRKVCSMA